MTTGNQVVVQETGEIIEAQPIPIKLSPQAIAIIQENIVLAEKLVTSVLEREVDWGAIQGLKGEVLFDPGASKIMAAFNCYPRHKVIFHQDTEDAISWTIEVDLISRDSQQIVATGLGGASTREGKWGKRWSKNPLSAGYTEEEANQLPQKTSDYGETLYKIDNPEIGELGHTLLVMAAKRAECDAAKSLPGVASALRKLFDPKLRKTMETGDTAASTPDAGAPPAKDGETDLTYPQFWGIVKGAGISEDSAHRALGVDSLITWVNRGQLLRDAVKLILQKAIILAKKATPGQAAPQAKKTLAEKTVDQITSADIPDTDALVLLAKKYFNRDESVLFTSFGYNSRKDFEESNLQTPWSLFEALRLEQTQ